MWMCDVRICSHMHIRGRIAIVPLKQTSEQNYARLFEPKPKGLVAKNMLRRQTWHLLIRASYGYATLHIGSLATCIGIAWVVARLYRCAGQCRPITDLHYNYFTRQTAKVKWIFCFCTGPHSTDTLLISPF